jgi:hypothetical protein
VVIEVPANKVKLMVGPGGERIKLIQRKSKCRVQARARPAHADSSRSVSGRDGVRARRVPRQLLGDAPARTSCVLHGRLRAATFGSQHASS